MTVRRNICDSVQKSVAAGNLKAGAGNELADAGFQFEWPPPRPGL
jgi:hypothetical protein